MRPCCKPVPIVDVAAAKALGIPVCNIPTYGTSAVAQFVFALLLHICHHVGDHSAAVKNGDWTTCKDFCFWNFPLVELKDKTIGIIGYGRIGQDTAKIASSTNTPTRVSRTPRRRSFPLTNCSPVPTSSACIVPCSIPPRE